MKDRLHNKQRLYITAFFSIALVAVLTWEFFNDGVATHYLLHSDEMPGISNWWGLLILPLFTWIVSGLIRVYNHQYQGILLRALVLFLFGVLISVVFVTNPASSIPTYLTGLLFIVSLFIPLYKAEYLLGYVLGTLFLFGAIIPVVAGTILWILFYLLYKIPRKLLAFIR